MKTLSTTICLVLLVLSGAASVAQAQPMVRKVSDMNRAAMEDYDILEFDAASKRLDEALGIIDKNKLGDHPIAARTHMNLGIVYGGGLGDADRAVEHFTRALEIDPTIELDPAYRSPELQRLHDRAKQAAGTKPPPGDPGLDSPGEVKGLLHTPTESARAGKNIDLEIGVGRDVRAKSVLLFFRVEGADAFSQVKMKRVKADGGSWVAQIPGKVTRDVSAVHYYMVAVNDGGKVLASEASRGSPHIIAIEQSGTADDGRPRRGQGRDDDGRVTSDGSDYENPLDEDAENRRNKKPGVFMAVRVGSGAGYITESTESANQPVSCCVAPSLFHVAPEVGFWVGPRSTLSVVARIGFPVGANIEGHATLAPAGLLRLAYYTGARGTGWVFHGDAGFGLIRQTVKLQDVPTGTTGDTDTYATGPLLIGGGTGYSISLSNSMRMVFDLNILMGIAVVDELGSAVPGFGVNFDGSLGLAWVL